MSVLEFTEKQIYISFVYLVSIALFIVGIKSLSSAKTARKGNTFSAAAMLIAIIAALFEKDILNPGWIITGIAIGGIIGVFFAYKVQMTEMPEMVALFNGFGGGASTLVATSALVSLATTGTGALDITEGVIIAASIVIGTFTFTGSIIAYGKLQGKISSQPIIFPGQRIVNALMFIAMFTAIAFVIKEPTQWNYLYVTLFFAAILGMTLVIPIGGADMPVVISLLNSYSGLAAAATGFVLNNYVLIVAGSLVGASGVILTKIMCEAMNRSLANVLFGAFSAGSTIGKAGDFEKRSVKSYSIEDVIIQLESANSVVFVPGYGLAVAQAQHTVQELAEILQARGVEVRYAIHPVAGRMPGHMNVLLAEASVDYELQIEMDDINPEFENTDVTIVVGANDVINPAARDDEASPIYGMPILEVDKSNTTIVIKRSLSPGFAGIDNDLFYQDNTMMIFGDAKKVLVNMVTQAKNELS